MEQLIHKGFGSKPWKRGRKWQSFLDEVQVAILKRHLQEEKDVTGLATDSLVVLLIEINHRVEHLREYKLWKYWVHDRGQSQSEEIIYHHRRSKQKAK